MRHVDYLDHGTELRGFKVWFDFNDANVIIMSGINRKAFRLLYRIAWYGRNLALGLSPDNRKPHIEIDSSLHCIGSHMSICTYGTDCGSQCRIAENGAGVS